MNYDNIVVKRRRVISPANSHFAASLEAALALHSVVGGLWIPGPYVAQPPVHTGTTFLIDASGDRAALIFRAPKAGDIDRFDAAIVVSNSPDNGMRFSLQSVDAATGLNSGTILGATNQASITYNHTVTTGWKSTPFTEAATVTRGQLLAAVVDIPSFTASDSITVTRTTVGSAHRASALPYGVQDAGTKAASYMPIMAIHYTDGYVPIAPHYMGGADTIALTTAFNVDSSTADEWALAFSLPAPCKLSAVQIGMLTAAGSDFEVIVYGSDGSTVLASVAIDGDTTNTGAEGGLTAYFTSEVELAADTTYRVAVRPTTTTSIQLRYWTFQSLALMDSVEGGQGFYMSSRLDQGGSWTDYNSGTFRKPSISLLLNAITGPE
jgi:hypothetical protein